MLSQTDRTSDRKRIANGSQIIAVSATESEAASELSLFGRALHHGVGLRTARGRDAMMALTRAVESQALAAMVAREPDLVAEERWAAIPGYEDTYCISETGRVWSKPRPTTSGGLLTRRFDRHGYPHVTLVQGGKQKRHKLHALVMLAFVGPRPEGMEIRHLDGSRDPHLPILAYGTHAENMRDVVEHGLHPMQQIASCPHGHPYDEANTYVWRGRRFCKACRHNQYRARRDGGVQ